MDNLLIGRSIYYRQNNIYSALLLMYRDIFKYSDTLSINTVTNLCVSDIANFKFLNKNFKSDSNYIIDKGIVYPPKYENDNIIITSKMIYDVYLNDIHKYLNITSNSSMWDAAFTYKSNSDQDILKCMKFSYGNNGELRNNNLRYTAPTHWYGKKDNIITVIKIGDHDHEPTKHVIGKLFA